MGKTKADCKKLDVLTEKQKCVFCQTRDIDEMKYGPIYQHKTIITHYYCLLLSSNMEQNGRDSDGILGFLATDMTKEVKRGLRLYCSFCRGGGATLGCAVARCKVVFHLPCGMKHGTLHQFFGEFKSFCAKHRPVQKITEKILAESSKGAICGICYEKVVPRPIHETLWAPCCQKNAFFHRDCVQQLAISAGYFFKCPLCNNTTTFQQSMKEFGIYIPEQDASWECVPQAYEDLLVRHETCDSAKCICPSGRKTNVSGTRWELILCKFCGSQGMHIGCGRLKWKSPEFECDICSGTRLQEQEGNTRNYNGNRHRLSGRTADIHPSVSADRERESSDDESVEDVNVTITNSTRRKKVIVPVSEPRVETPPPGKKSKHDKNKKKSVTSTIVSDSDKSEVSDSILIDDSDDDLEVVSITKSGNGCLKTNDGLTIPVIQVKEKQKRPRVEGDIRVLPDEIVDITNVVSARPKKPKSVSPPVMEEVVYNLNPQQPSTSAAYSAPSTSFAPPPDVGSFVLVNPATLRPEDLTPGTVFYRSVRPVLNVPQPPMQPQVPSQIPTSLPMQQLGFPGHADAKYPDLRKHRNRVINDLGTQHHSQFTKESYRSIRCDSVRRRGRPRRDCNRLNPRVVLFPIRFRQSSDGYCEIIVTGVHLGTSSSLKRRASPLPSRPLKKMKLGAPSPDKNHLECEQSKTKVLKKRSINKSGTRLDTFKLKFKENNKITLKNSKSRSPSEKVKMKDNKKSYITNFFNPLKTVSESTIIQRRGRSLKSKLRIINVDKENTTDKCLSTPVKTSEKNIDLIKSSSTSVEKSQKRKRRSPLIESDYCKYRKIDDYLRKADYKCTLNDDTCKSVDSLAIPLDEVNDKVIMVKDIVDDLIELVFQNSEKSCISEQTIVSDLGTRINSLKGEGESSSSSEDLIEKEDNILNLYCPVNLCDQKEEKPTDLFSVNKDNVGDNLEIISDSNCASNVDTIDKVINDEEESSVNEDCSVLEGFIELSSNLAESCINDHEKNNSFEIMSPSEKNEYTKRTDSNTGKHEPLLEVCKNIPLSSDLKCKTQTFGFFPKIKFSNRTKFIVRQTSSGNLLGKLSKNHTKIKLKNIEKNGVQKYANKKQSQSSKQEINTCANSRMSVINHYFVPLKKDPSSSSPSKVFNCVDNISKHCDNEIGCKDIESKTETSISENAQSVKHNIVPNSPEKRPLVELQINKMPSWGK